MKNDQVKQFLLLLLIMVVPFASTAQKANTKLVAIKYVQPPSKPLGNEVKTYYVKIVNEAAGFSTSTESAQDGISLEGYQRAATADDADLLIELVVNSVSSEGSVEKVEWKKKINDSTYVTKMGGKWTVNAFMNVNYQVKNKKNGKTLSSGSKSHSNVFESDRYDTYNSAVVASNEKKGAKGREMYKSIFINAVKAMNRSVNDQFGFPLRSTSQPIARGKGKKHDYSDLESAYNKFVQASQILESQGLNQDASSLLKDCVFTWETAKNEFDTSKKARISEKNIGEINYNIAVAKLLLQDFSGAKAALETAKGTKVSINSINSLQTLATDLEQRHTVNK